MNQLNNPILVSIVQTVFYGAIAALLPALVGMITSGNLVIPYGLTGIVLVLLNYADNAIQAKTGKALFGSIS